MDVLEIFTVIRNIQGLEKETDVSTREMLRAVNLGYRNLCKLVKDKILPYMTMTGYQETLSSATFNYPEDCAVPVNIKRDSKKASPVKLFERSLIGTNVNYPSDENNPLYIDNGEYAEIFPTPSGDVVSLDYFRFPPDLLFGNGDISDSDIVLIDGKKINDYYNNTHLAIYQRIEATLSFIESGKITDYVGSTKTATTDLTDNNSIIYASVPLIPEMYHRYLPDFALIELAKMQKVDNKVADLAAAVINQQFKMEAA